VNRGLLTPGTLPRALAGTALGALAVIIATQFVLPSPNGAGTPPAIIFFGLVLGLLNALIAAGIILIYRTARIINFAQAALGSVGGVFTYNLAILLGWNFFLALVAGLIISMIAGAAIELLIVRRFFNAPRLVLTVATIALIPLMGYLAGSIRSLTLFNAAQASISTTIGVRGMTLPFDEFEFFLGDVSFPFGFEHLFAGGASLVALAALAWFLGFTRYGIAVRANSENSERAQLLGIDVKMLSTIVWVIAAVMSGLGVILTMAVLQTGPLSGSDSTVLIPGLVAAVLARMRSFPVGVGSAIGITVIQQGLEWGAKDHVDILFVVLLVLVLASLFLQREQMQRSEQEEETTSWEASEEIRPTPREMLTVGSLRAGRWVLLGLGLLSVLAIFPLAARTAQLQTAGFVAISGIVILSLVVLTGWANQVSLGQFALVGIAAMAAGYLTRKAGVSFWLVLFLVPLLMIPFSMLLGLPALRVKGLYLAVVTGVFAYVVQRVMFNENYFEGIIPDRVDRPILFFFDFQDERSMYFLSVALLILCLLLVTSMRRTRTGRVLIALRENESNVQSFGINLVRARLLAFGVSGFLCGIAGVLMAHHQRAVSADTFNVDQSLMVFLTAVVGGISSVSGALLGSGFLAITTLFPSNPIVQFFAQGGAVLVILYVAPGGLAGLLYSVRDSILRVVAQRRQMIVPSLFADFDPRQHFRRLAPLAEPIPNAGLAVVPVSKRFKGRSIVHRPHSDEDGGRRAPDDTGAIRAAAGRLEGEEEAAATPKVQGALGR
jgi:branched-chain amino acid transport system permease protein